VLFRRRIWWFVLSGVIAIALITQQVFIQVPLVQAQTWTEYYDSLSKNPLPADGINSKLMFDGAWSATGYQCLLTASTAVSTAYPEPYPETVNITVDNGILNTATVYGSECVPTGNQTFSAYPLSTIRNQSSFPITFITGTGDNPISTSVQATLRVIDKDFFVIRVPSFRYVGSDVDEQPQYIEFRRSSAPPATTEDKPPCNDSRIQDVYDPNDPNYHAYTPPLVTEICSKNNSYCTKEMVAFIMVSQKRFVAPAIPSIENTPVVNCEEVNLIDDPAHDNRIKTVINNDELSVTNYTLPGHVFYPGKVKRKILDNGNSILIETTGEGTGDYRRINEGLGRELFSGIDANLRDYVNSQKASGM
jgi:hypothetical protein